MINFLGSWGGSQVLPIAAMIKLMDRTVRAPGNLSVETDQNLMLTMHFPTSWDPYFGDTMSVFEVYHYGTQHFDHHRKQLTV